MLSAKKNSPSYVFDRLQHTLEQDSARSYYTAGKANVITATSFKDKSATMNLICNYIASKLIRHQLNILTQLDDTVWQPTCPKVTVPGGQSPKKGKFNVRLPNWNNFAHLTTFQPRTIVKPLCMQEYVYAKGFVDETARQLHTFSWPHRFQKWTQALFSAMLGLTTWNAFIYFKNINECFKGDYRFFLEKLAEKLAEKQTRSPRKPSRLNRVRNCRGKIIQAVRQMQIPTKDLHTLVPAKYFSSRVRGWCNRCPKGKKQQTTLICLGCSLAGTVEFQCTACSKSHSRIGKLFA